MDKKHIKLGMTLFLLAAMYCLAKEAAVHTGAGACVSGGEKVVVIDVGHGGKDPGKVGVNGVLEKDINLDVALKLESFLRQSDVKVLLTRKTDEGLYDENAGNKKVQDMARRIALIEACDADLVVSIHQNSYGDGSVCGPQCFYHVSSPDGERAALILQQWLNGGLAVERPREAKSDGSYYLLKKSTVPTVIAECGFLSNEKEAVLLTDEVYQEKVAWALYMGILAYFNAE